MLVEEDTVYIVRWDHKHGQDISLHKTEEGADAKRITWMRGVLEEWGEAGYDEVPDDELHLHWAKISGETEFFSVDKFIICD